MQIRITSHRVIMSRALQALIRTQVGERLRRFAAVIEGVHVEMADRNGRRGGGDKRCRIRVMLAGGVPIVEDEVRANPWTAVRRAVRRLESAVHRRLRSSVALVQAGANR